VKKIMVLGKSIPLIVLIIIPIVMGGVAASFISRFLLTKPASVTVSTNDHSIELYSDEALTTVVTAITFPEVAEGDLQGMTSTTPDYWIALKDTASFAEPYWYVTCDHTGLPTGLILTARRYRPTQGDWIPWPTGELGCVSLPPTSSIKIRFILNCGAAEVGTYSFDIKLLAGTGP